MTQQFTRAGHDNVKFFIGPEVEQTAAFCKKTLFVVGLQKIDEIESFAQENNIRHIFLTANRCFDNLELANGIYKVGKHNAIEWNIQTKILLSKGYQVSIDYPAHKHVDVLQIFDKAVWANRNFIPILSVVIPEILTSNINLTVKIDDKSFNASNPGVWCMNYREVTDNNRFTSWQDYADDEIVDYGLKAPGLEEPEPIVRDMTIKNDETIGLDLVTKSNPEVDEKKKSSKVGLVQLTDEYTDTPELLKTKKVKQ